jgi:hypothetical protein
MITSRKLSEDEVFHVQREVNTGVWLTAMRGARTYDEAVDWSTTLTQDRPTRIIMERQTVFLCEEDPVHRLTTATETETGKPAADFICIGTGHQGCNATPVMVILEDGQFDGAASCAEHVEDVKRYMTRSNRVWEEES